MSGCRRFSAAARTAILAVATALLAIGNPAWANTTLAQVQDRGYLRCGVNQGLPGFSNPDDKGRWTGLDADFCRAVAAATLGSASKVKYIPLSAKERFTALQSGEVDLLARNTTWTLARDSAMGIHFVGVNYYDGQGFMVRRDLGVDSALELDGATVCTGTGTTTELNLSDYFRANNMHFQPIVFEKADEVIAAYDAGRCDVFSGDQTALYAQRSKLKNPEDHKVLPEIISKEPLGPAVRQGDDNWFNVVRWTLHCMVNAEELGLNSDNVAAMARGKDPVALRMLGREGESGKSLGLSHDWCKNIITQVGNYGEAFERNLSQPPLNIERGLNALWKDGGLIYAPPIR